MKKIIAGVMGFLMMGMIVVEAGAASRSSSRVASSPRAYSAPKTYAAPKAAPTPTRTTTNSNPGLKALGFTRPASAPTVSRPSANVSSKVAPTSTVSSGWFGKKTVSSVPAYKAPVRKVSSPVGYSSNRSVYSSPRTTVIQRNYYSNNSYGGYNGYNRGYGGYGYNSYGGYSSAGSSFLSGAAGAVGGMMLYNALTTPHHNVNSGATAAQIEQAKTDQRIEDKLDMQNQLLMQQNAQTVATAPVVMQQPQCFLPPDAPLMMSPQFYCGVNNAK